MAQFLTFYAHAIFRLPASIVSPIVIGATIVALTTLGFIGLISLRVMPATRGSRLVSFIALVLSIWFGIISSIPPIVSGSMSLGDWGSFTIQLVLPLLVMFIDNRRALLRKICQVCVLFSLVDLVVHLATAYGIVGLAGSIGGNESGYGFHYLGLPGNSLAEGIVAFVAVTYVASRLTKQFSYHNVFGMMLISTLMFSEWMIRARTDIGMSIVAIMLLLFRRSYRVSLVIISIIISFSLLAGTFLGNPFNTDERLRSDLILNGFDKAALYPIIGQGAHYRSTSELIADYQQLKDAGVTESGTLDHAISYGIPSIILLYLSVFMVLGASRDRQSLPVVLLTCLTGSMVLAGSVDSLFGALIFYLSLTISQREELWLVRSAGESSFA